MLLDVAFFSFVAKVTRLFGNAGVYPVLAMKINLGETSHDYNEQFSGKTNIFSALTWYLTACVARFARLGELSRKVGETGGRNELHFDSPP